VCEGKRVSGTKFLQSSGPLVYSSVTDECAASYICRLTDECTGPTFVGFKPEEYSPFIFLGTEECILLYCSARSCIATLAEDWY
jgi:hypothetical protein